MAENIICDGCARPEGQQPDGRYSRWFTLGATEVDLNNRLRLMSLLGFFQETAGDQCELFGSGWSTLWGKHGLCYVVVRMEIRMDRYLGTGEQIRVDTWPDPKLRQIFARYGEIFDASGSRIGSIVSQWALLDVKERHFVRPTPEIVAMPDTSSLTPPFELPRDRRGAFDEERDDPGVVKFSFPRTLVYSDYDYNRHMNNARYAEWVCDALWNVLPADVRANDPLISRIDIKFRTEIPAALVNTSLELSGTLDPETRLFYVRGIGRPSEDDPGTVHFEAEAEYFSDTGRA